MTTQTNHYVQRDIAHGTASPALQVMGPTVEFLTPPGEADDGLCVMRGVIPPGGVVPLHSHHDREAFFLLEGTQQVLTPGDHGLEWDEVHAGDYVDVPPGALHAFRNVFGQPAVQLILTTARMGKFFEEVGQPVDSAPMPPGPDDVDHFVNTAIRYGYTLGTPEENAAEGIELPES